jgi:hypothetical protein
MRPLLADPSLKPSKEQILAARSNLRDLLAIRYSSPLFRLGSAEAIQVRESRCELGKLLVHNVNDGGLSNPLSAASGW